MYLFLLSILLIALMRMELSIAMRGEGNREVRD